MKSLTLALLLITVVVSCKEKPIEVYTLKVHFKDGSIDTLNVRGSYEIDDKGNLGSLKFGYYGNIATGVKYVKEINKKIIQ